MKEAAQEACTRPRAFLMLGVLFTGVFELDPSTFAVHCLPICLRPVRCNRDVEVVTGNRSLQEDSRYKRGFIVNQSPEALKSLLGWAKSCPHGHQLHCSGRCRVYVWGTCPRVTRPMGLVCCGTFWESSGDSPIRLLSWCLAFPAHLIVLPVLAT